MAILRLQYANMERKKESIGKLKMYCKSYLGGIKLSKLTLQKMRGYHFRMRD